VLYLDERHILYNDGLLILFTGRIKQQLITSSSNPIVYKHKWIFMAFSSFKTW